MQPLSISLVTPNLDYAHHLPATLDSVLGQSYPNIDYIMIDGGSRDASVEVARDRSVRCIVEPGLGQYESINRGFAETTGEIMGWLNSDDVHHPWTLRAVAGIFGAFPEIEWIMGAPAVIQDGVVQKVAQARPLDRDCVRLGLMSGGDFGLVQQESCFWRRSLWERAGGLDPSAGLAADFELWMRFARHAEPVACTALLGGFSVHTTNRSRLQSDRYAADMEKAVARLSAKERIHRETLRQDIARYHRWKHFPGLKRMARLRGRLLTRTGSIVRRDIAANIYRLDRDHLYP